MSSGKYKDDCFVYSDFRMSEREQCSDIRSSIMSILRASCVFTVISEIVLYLIITVITLLLAYNRVVGVEPFKRGLFCDDQTLRYPFKDDTVSDTLLAALFVAVPAVILAVVETVHVLKSKEREARGYKAAAHRLLSTYYRTVGCFLLAALCTMFLTETAKVFGGRLRPNFISVCKPNFSKVNCSEGFVMIGDELCSSVVEHKELLDARKSFPSGHASVSTCGALYLLIYLQLRFIWTRRIRVLLPIIQTCIVCGSIFVSISRVNDNKHHASDVIGGAILGASVAIFTIKYVSCVRRSRHNTEDYLVSDFHHDAATNPVHLKLPQTQTISKTGVVVEMRDL